MLVERHGYTEVRGDSLPPLNGTEEINPLQGEEGAERDTSMMDMVDRTTIISTNVDIDKTMNYYELCA